MNDDQITTPLARETQVLLPRKDTANRVMRYDFRDPLVEFDSDGRPLDKPQLWLPSIHNADDVFDETIYETEPNALGWVYRIGHSRRCGIITRIDVKMPGHDWVATLARVDTGQELGNAALYMFHLGTPNKVGINPTAGGATDPDGGQWEGSPTVRHLHGSPTTMLRFPPPDGDRLIHESEVIPLHFGDHFGPIARGGGGDKQHPVIMPRFRHAMRFSVNVLGANVVDSRLTEYCPVRIPADPSNGLSRNTGWWMPGPGGAAVFVEPGKPDHRWSTAPYWNDDRRHIFYVTCRNSIVQEAIRTGDKNNPWRHETQTVPFAADDGGLMACIMPSTRPGFPVIAAVGRMHRDDDDMRRSVEISAMNRVNSPNWTGLPHVDERDRNAGRSLRVAARGRGRAKGDATTEAVYVLGDSVQQVETALHASAAELRQHFEELET